MTRLLEFGIITRKGKINYNEKIVFSLKNIKNNFLLT